MVSFLFISDYSFSTQFFNSQKLSKYLFTKHNSVLFCSRFGVKWFIYQAWIAWWQSSKNVLRARWNLSKETVQKMEYSVHNNRTSDQKMERKWTFNGLRRDMTAAPPKAGHENGYKNKAPLCDFDNVQKPKLKFSIVCTWIFSNDAWEDEEEKILQRECKKQSSLSSFVFAYCGKCLEELTNW